MPLIIVDVVDVDYQRLTLTVLYILGGGEEGIFSYKKQAIQLSFSSYRYFQGKELERFQFFTN